MRKKNVESAPYRTSGVEQFFLPELPAWANHSASGRCFKSSSFQYLDFAKLADTYNLNYRQMVELQAQFNERREIYFSSTAHRFLKPVEEASFFSNTLEQVRGGVRHFSLPNVPEVDVVWLEAYLQTGKLAQLKQDVQNGRFDERPPVLFSTCFSRSRLTQWVTDEGLDPVGFFLLSAEWLSPFDSTPVLRPGLRIEFAKIINDGVKINLITPEAQLLPTELILPKGVTHVRNDEAPEVLPQGGSESPQRGVQDQ